MQLIKPLLLTLLLLLPFKNIMPEAQAEKPCGCGIETLKWHLNMEMIMAKMTAAQDTIPPYIKTYAVYKEPPNQRVIETIPNLMSNLCKRITAADSIKFEIEDVKNDFMKFFNIFSIYSEIKDPAEKIAAFLNDKRYQPYMTCETDNSSTGKRYNIHLYKKAALDVVLDFFNKFLFSDDYVTEDENDDIVGFAIDLNIVEIVELKDPVTGKLYKKAETLYDFIERSEKEALASGYDTRDARRGLKGDLNDWYNGKTVKQLVEEGLYTPPPGVVY